MTHKPPALPAARSGVVLEGRSVALADRSATYRCAQAHRGRTPQLPVHVSPGATVIRSTPELSASGGHVIGSTATARAPLPGNSAGVNTCTQPKHASAQSSTPAPSPPGTA